jgi:bacillithiol biosynthesis deacetylase BshB1
MSDPYRPADLVVFAAHPDDAELSCGGLLLVSRARGWRTAVVDMTRGELSTRGTVPIRDRESEEAARVLGLAVRANLGLPDGGVRDTDEGRRAVVRAIRSMRPRLVVAPPVTGDHHPDHTGTGELVLKSIYLSGIRKFVPELEPHRPRALLHYPGTRSGRPTIVLDISSVIEDRRKAVLCHGSQVGPLEPGQPVTRISHPDFLEHVDARLRHYGWMIGVRYGEGYHLETPLPAGDLVGLFEIEPWKPK